jgi:hypothetical protein
MAGSALETIVRRTTMKFGGFLHLNIRYSLEDIPAIEKFYADVLGLKAGYRPNFKFGGDGNDLDGNLLCFGMESK